MELTLGDFQAGLTIGMTAQHTVLNTALLLDSTLPGFALNGVICLAGAALGAGVMGEPVFIQLHGKKEYRSIYNKINRKAKP